MLKNTRTEIAEYVKNALATNQKIPMIEKLKSEYANKIDQKKHINKLRAERQLKQQELKRLKDYSARLEKIIDEKLPSDVSHITSLQNEIDDIEFKLETEKMTRDTLRHMLSRDKKSMFHKLKPIEKLKFNIYTVQSSINSIKKEVLSVKNEEQNILTDKLDVQETVIKQNDLMCKDINYYLKNFKERELIKTIKSHIKDVAKKQKEIIQKQKLDLKTTKNKLKEIKQEEDRNKFKDSLEKLRRQQDLLAKIQSRCNIRDIKDLVTYQGYLSKTNEQLNYQNNALESEKQQKLQKLQELKQKFNEIALYKDREEDSNKIKVEHTLE